LELLLAPFFSLSWTSLAFLHKLEEVVLACQKLANCLDLQLVANNVGMFSYILQLRNMVLWTHLAVLMTFRLHL
jgi:hypothetical protein